MANIIVDDFVEFMDYVCNGGIFANAPAHLRDYSNPMDKYSEVDFIQRFRFSKETVRDNIMPIMEENLNSRGLPIPPIIKLTCALRFYATGNYQVCLLYEECKKK